MNIRTREFLVSLAFVLPAFALFLLLVYYPFFSSLYYSFTQWDGITAAKFIGLANYERVFTEQALAQAVRNTVYFLAATLLIGNPLFLVLGITLNRPLRTRGLLRTVYYLPQIMSIVVMSMIWGAILQYDGVANAILHSLGLDGWIRDWFGSKKTAMNAMILFNTWQSAGFGAIIVLAGLQSIPQEIYEAAKIEGAAGWKSFRHVTLPLLAPSLTIINFLLLIGGLKYFEAPLILTNGGPSGSTMTISLLIYRIAFQYKTLGYATAAGVMFFLLITVCTLALLHFSRKREVEY